MLSDDMKSCELDVHIQGAMGTVLSIVIPTYNRVAELQVLMNSLLPQALNDGAGQVEIIVCDNASTDGTQSYVTELAETGVLTYYRHTHNIGPVPQLFVGPARANGKYCWVLGDDDRLKPGAIRTILDTIETHEPDFISMNRDVYDSQLEKRLQTISAPEASTIYPTYAKFCETFDPNQIGFISCQIFKTKPFTDLDPAPFFENPGGYAHLGMYLAAFHDKPTVYIAEPLVDFRFANSADPQAVARRNSVDLSAPLIHTLETGRAIADLPSDIWQTFTGLTGAHNQPHIPLSDYVLRYITTALAIGHEFTKSDIDLIKRVSTSWTIDAQGALTKLLDLADTPQKHKNRLYDFAENVLHMGAKDAAQSFLILPSTSHDADIINCTTEVETTAPSGSVLSIIIPTYNRTNELQILLNNLFAERVGDLVDKVDIVVCDNASTDETQNKIHPFAEQRLISYYRHTENIGAVPQLFVGPTRARAPYCWVLGDDDLLQDGALGTIVDYLENHTPTFLTINREVRDRHLKTVEHTALNPIPSAQFETYIELCEHMGPNQLGFISCQIFKTDVFTAVNPAPYMTVPGGYQQLGVYLQAFANHTAHYLADPLIIHRYGNWDDHKASLKTNFVSLAAPLAHAIEVARNQLNLDTNIWQTFKAGAASGDDKNLHIPLSDIILENTARAIALGHQFTPEHMNIIKNVTGYWPHKRQQALQAILQLADDIEKLNANKAQDIKHAKQAIETLNNKKQYAKADACQNQLMSRVKGLESDIVTRKKLLSGMAAQIYSFGLDTIIKTKAEQMPKHTLGKKCA